MADFLTNGVLVFTGAPPSATLPFASTTTSGGGLTFTDNDGGSSLFETSDTITANAGFPGNWSYEGTTAIPLSAGGTVTVPVLTNGSQTIVLLPGGMSLSAVNIPNPLDASALTTTGFTVCFAAGTLIATPTGDTKVEELKIGDMVRNSDGQDVPIKWVGRQTIHKLFAGPRMQPVRIRAGALGGGLPYSDLTVTADHGMVFPSSSEAVGENKQNGYVINASALVNGDTIDFVAMAELDDSFTVYHIETEDHDVILANGAATETFVDAAGRANFDNHQEYLDLYRVERIIPEMQVSRICSARLVPKSVTAHLAQLSDRPPHANQA